MGSIKVLCCFIITLLIISCGSSKNDIQSNAYEIVRYKSYIRYGSIPTGTFITIDLYDDKNRGKREPAFYSINNVIFDDFHLVEDDLKPVTISVFPGSFDIQGYSEIKLPTRINNLKIKDGDSVVVKIYLIDDPQAYTH